MNKVLTLSYIFSTFVNIVCAQYKNKMFNNNLNLIILILFFYLFFFRKNIVSSLTSFDLERFFNSMVQRTRRIRDFRWAFLLER